MSEITFAEIDPAEIEASVLTTYEGIAEVTLYPGDPVRLFLESLAYLIALQNNLINLVLLQPSIVHCLLHRTHSLSEQIVVQFFKPSTGEWF